MKTLILFLLITVFGTAQIEINNDIRVDHGNALLWKISGNGLNEASFLFGTMHLIEKKNFLFTNKLERKFKRSQSLIMELNGMPDPQRSLQLIMLEKGEFFDFFTKEQTDSIITWAYDNFKIDEPMFKLSFTKMKPFVVTQMATQLYFQGKTESYEMTFEKMARELDIKISGLETVEEQMGLFDKLSKEQQAEMLMEAIRKHDENLQLTKQMQTIYSEQNLHQLYDLITSSDGVISDEQNKFLDQRNVNWIPKIASEISKNKTFIAVGAGHLDGQNGVIQLLINQGFTLTPIQL